MSMDPYRGPMVVALLFGMLVEALGDGQHPGQHPLGDGDRTDPRPVGQDDVRPVEPRGGELADTRAHRLDPSQMGRQPADVVGGIQGEQDLGPSQITQELGGEKRLELAELVVVGLVGSPGALVMGDLVGPGDHFGVGHSAPTRS